MKAIGLCVFLFALVILPATAEAGGCHVQRIQQVQVQQVVVPVQSFVVQPVQAVTTLQVVQPVVVQQVVQPVVVQQVKVVRQRAPLIQINRFR